MRQGRRLRNFKFCKVALNKSKRRLCHLQAATLSTNVQLSSFNMFNDGIGEKTTTHQTTLWHLCVTNTVLHKC